MSKIHSKKGFTLIEVLAVVVILGILIACVSFAVSGTLDKGRLSSTQNSLQLFAADIEEILATYGVLSISDGDPTPQIKEYLSMIETYYMHTYFDYATLEVKDTYFEILTTTMRDGWDSQFLLRYCFTSEDAGTCMLISPGNNLLFDTESYTNTYFGDDILLIVYPKTI